MSNFVLFTDSCCDLPKQMADELGLTVVPLRYTIDGVEYENLLNVDNSEMQIYYEKLRQGSVSTTSAINIGDYTVAFEPVLAEGKDILVLSFSSALSTSCNSAKIAAEDLLPKYPERKIYVVDTLCASMGEGLFVYYVAEKAKSGADIDAVRDYAEDLKLKIIHWFTVDDLKFLMRGGRISKAQAFFGGLLQIKPIMYTSSEGKLLPESKARGRLAALNTLADKLCANIVDPENQMIFISHGDSLADAEKLKDMVQKRIKVKGFVINHIGPVIGAHSGPGTVAIFYIGDKRFS